MILLIILIFTFQLMVQAKPSTQSKNRFTTFGLDVTRIIDEEDGEHLYLPLITKPFLFTTERISITVDGAQSNGDSMDPDISDDGRLIVFKSFASNIIAGDMNNTSDCFILDRQTGLITLASITTNGSKIGWCNQPDISGDGQYVAFYSWSPFTPDDTNWEADVFVHDLQGGETTRISVSTAGTQGNGGSYSPAISANGRFITFQSLASNLVSDDTNNEEDIFVHDRQTGETTRVSVASDGTQSNSGSYSPAISGNGRVIAFATRATNLIPNDVNDFYSDILVHDRQTRETVLVSKASNGTQGNDMSAYPSLSADGRTIAFESAATNLISNESYGGLFVHDRQTGETTRVSVASDGTIGNGFNPILSADGRYVAFWSDAPNLVPNDINGEGDAFVHDRQTGETTRISISCKNYQGNLPSGYPALSAHGRYIVFESSATNLIPNDSNSYDDIFLYDRGFD